MRLATVSDPSDSTRPDLHRRSGSYLSYYGESDRPNGIVVLIVDGCRIGEIMEGFELSAWYGL